MKFDYGQYTGEPFPTPDSLFPEPKVVEFILQYGQQALDAMQQLDNPDEQNYLQMMLDAGLLEEAKDGEGEGDEGKGKLRLTPRMVKGIQHKALLDMFQHMRPGPSDAHPTGDPGRSAERVEGTKPYEFGDPLSELDLGTTMRNAMARHAAQQQQGGSAARPASASSSFKLESEDFELHLTEGGADCATVVLIDQSGSMMRWRRFYQAKRVALGLLALVAGRYPRDTIDLVGFYSLADRIREADLPLVMPKPVTVHDYQVRLRVPLDQAQQHPARIPQHFTNLHMGLRLARRILSRRGALNKQIFIITDGQPTAHIEPNTAGDAAGEMLYLLYPPTEQTATVTLKEALRCQQQGIRIATFALIEDYFGMDWVGFVDRMTRLTHGLAYYCTSEDLSSTVIESFIAGRRKRSYIK